MLGTVYSPLYIDRNELGVGRSCDFAYALLRVEDVGNSMVNFAPFPDSLSKVMLPPSASVSFFTTAKPNP